jgi:hypothetical protein
MHEPGRWSLSPAYDINPVPEMDRVRMNKTAITEDQQEVIFEPRNYTKVDVIVDVMNAIALSCNCPLFKGFTKFIPRPAHLWVAVLPILRHPRLVPVGASGINDQVRQLCIGGGSQ